MWHLVAALVLCLTPIARASAQSSPADTTPQWLTVFLDCRTSGCDRNYLIQDLPYVLWTQDRFDAEVHALVTELGTGSGGIEYTVALVGQRRFEGRADTLVTTVAPNSTFDMQRRELTRVLKIGLGPYALRTIAGTRLAMNYTPSPDSSAKRAVSDPWNFWVYRVGASGDVGAESQSSDFELEGELSAIRITDDWKLIIEGEYSYNGLTFRPDSGPSERFMNRQAEFEMVALRSVTARWSTGAALGAEVDEFRNQNLTAWAEVAAEWNYFPWAQATSRQLTFGGGFSAVHFDYNEVTIYNRTRETRMLAKLQVSSEVRQPWGSLNAGARHTRYLHDFNIYSAEIFSFLDVRISRGLSLNIGGSASKVNDQLFLPAGGLSPGEILTQQRALRTAYRMDFSAGLSFTFGSIFNTFVNPRFDNYQ